MVAKFSSKVISLRLLTPLKMLTLLNLETPVRKTNCSSPSSRFRGEYRLFKPSRISSAVSGFSILSNRGLSYSSTRTTTGILYFSEAPVIRFSNCRPIGRARSGSGKRYSRAFSFKIWDA